MIGQDIVGHFDCRNDRSGNLLRLHAFEGVDAGTLEKRGVGRAGTDRAHPDTVHPQLFHERFGKTVQSEFRGTVGSTLPETPFTRYRRDVDDGAGTLAFHLRDDFSGTEKRRREVDRDHFRPSFRRYGFDFAEQAETGVVHENVDTGFPLPDGMERFRDCCGHGEIGFCPVETFMLYGRSATAETIDNGAFDKQLSGGVQADAGTCSGDDGDTVLEVHGQKERVHEIAGAEGSREI